MKQIMRNVLQIALRIILAKYYYCIFIEILNLKLRAIIVIQNGKEKKEHWISLFESVYQFEVQISHPY